MKINIPCELNQKKMWLSKPSHIEGLLLSPSTLSICLRDCFRPPNPHPPPYNCPCPFLCSFLLLQTDRVLKKGFIGLDAPSDSGGRLSPWHAQVSSTRPSTGLPATCVQPSLGLNCGEEWKQRGNRGTEEEEDKEEGEPRKGDLKVEKEQKRRRRRERRVDDDWAAEACFEEQTCASPGRRLITQQDSIMTNWLLSLS